MSHSKAILFVGGVGSGKTLLMLDEVRRDFELSGAKYLYTNHPVNSSALPPGVQVVDWSDMASTHDFVCGAWVLDECDNWLNSRKASLLSDDARTKIKEHRKDHLRAYFTTQHTSMVDRVFRFFFDEVRVVERVSIPFLGFFFPSMIRPTLRCAHCGMVRPDGVGDNEGWRRYLGFATVFFWKVYPPDVLGEIESTNASVIEERAGRASQEPLKTGWRFFNNRMIQIYDTSHKTARRALEDMKKTGKYNR